MFRWGRRTQLQVFLPYENLSLRIIRPRAQWQGTRFEDFDMFVPNAKHDTNSKLPENYNREESGTFMDWRIDGLAK